MQAASGKYEQYEDLPGRTEYKNVVTVLLESGLNE
jgi:hypothetical protein